MNPESFYPQSATAQLNAVYNREARSPRVSNPPPQLPPIGRGPVPKFQKCTNTAELEPTINQQPPFRRAAPDGGFISVSGIRAESVCNALIMNLASSSANHTPAFYLQDMQPWLQIRIDAKPPTSPHETEQGSEE